MIKARAPVLTVFCMSEALKVQSMGIQEKKKKTFDLSERKKKKHKPAPVKGAAQHYTSYWHNCFSLNCNPAFSKKEEIGKGTTVSGNPGGKWRVFIANLILRSI